MRLERQIKPLLLAPARAAAGYPAVRVPEQEMGEVDRAHAGGLMRINHAGEVAAQGLYRGQALIARDARVRDQLLAAAAEEQAHLHWCEERLAELGQAPSVLRPFWHAGSFAIGVAAALAGDRWSLGFVAETEKQVSEHLEDHLRRLPPADERSRAVVAAMRDDEERHRSQAERAGARPLPRPVRGLMRRAAGVMKRLAYRI